MKIVCWNMKWSSNHEQAWAMLRAMDADIALLQKARKPPAGVDDWAEVNPEPWRIEGRTVQWRSAVARLSDLIDVEWIASKSIAQAGPYDFAVSRPTGTVWTTTDEPGWTREQGCPHLLYAKRGQAG